MEYFTHACDKIWFAYICLLPTVVCNYLIYILNDKISIGTLKSDKFVSTWTISHVTWMFTLTLMIIVFINCNIATIFQPTNQGFKIWLTNFWQLLKKWNILIIQKCDGKQYHISSNPLTTLPYLSWRSSLLHKRDISWSSSV